MLVRGLYSVDTHTCRWLGVSRTRDVVVILITWKCRKCGSVVSRPGARRVAIDSAETLEVSEVWKCGFLAAGAAGRDRLGRDPKKQIFCENFFGKDF